MNKVKFLVPGIAWIGMSTMAFAADQTLTNQDNQLLFGQPAPTTQRIEIITKGELESTKGGIECRLFYDRANNITFQICR